MAAVALPPQPVPAAVSHFDFSRDAAQGETGRRLHARAEQAFEHWTRRAAILVATSGADEFSYVSVPPNRTFSVKTRYVFSGKGKPLPFRLDEE
jgi:hypothetical protein